MAKVTSLPGCSNELKQADDLLEQSKGKLIECMVIGWTDDNQLYVQSTTGELGQCLVMLNLAQANLIKPFSQ